MTNIFLHKGNKDKTKKRKVKAPFLYLNNSKTLSPILPALQLTNKKDWPIIQPFLMPVQTRAVQQNITKNEIMTIKSIYPQ